MNESLWKPAELKSTYQLGDQIRVQEKSRAAIILSNETIIRLDQNTTITFNPGINKQVSPILDMLIGAIHFISRVPRTLKVTTPFVDGTVEGTEFMVSVTDHTSFIVFEGQVLTENDGGSLRLTEWTIGNCQVETAGSCTANSCSPQGCCSMVTLLCTGFTL